MLADLAGALEILETRDRLFERYLADPMQEIEIEMIGVEPFQAPLAGGHHALARGVVRIDLAHQKHLGALTRDRLGHHFFRAALAIHLGGVDQRHAEVDAEPQRVDDIGAAGARLAHTPRAEAQHRDGRAGREVQISHVDFVAATVDPSSLRNLPPSR